MTNAVKQSPTLSRVEIASSAYGLLAMTDSYIRSGGISHAMTLNDRF